MSFFTKISDVIGKDYSLQITLKQEGDKMSVSVLPEVTDRYSGAAKTPLRSIEISGSPAQLDVGLVDAIANPLRLMDEMIVSGDTFIAEPEVKTSLKPKTAIDLPDGLSDEVKDRLEPTKVVEYPPEPDPIAKIIAGGAVVIPEMEAIADADEEFIRKGNELAENVRGIKYGDNFDAAYKALEAYYGFKVGSRGCDGEWRNREEFEFPPQKKGHAASNHVYVQQTPTGAWCFGKHVGLATQGSASPADIWDTFCTPDEAMLAGFNEWVEVMEKFKDLSKADVTYRKKLLNIAKLEIAGLENTLHIPPTYEEPSVFDQPKDIDTTAKAATVETAAETFDENTGEVMSLPAEDPDDLPFEGGTIDPNPTPDPVINETTGRPVETKAVKKDEMFNDEEW